MQKLNEEMMKDILAAGSKKKKKKKKKKRTINRDQFRNTNAGSGVFR